MPRTVPCPRCRLTLDVDPDAPGRWLTCPRCLCSIDNPNVLVSAEPAPAVEERPETSVRRTCPWCDRAVEPDWRTCPYCDRLLRRHSRGRRLPPADAEARPDMTGTWVGIGILGGLAVLGLGVLVGFGGDLARASDDGWRLLAAGAVLVVLLAVGCGVLAYTGKSGAGTTASVAAGAAGITAVVSGVIALLTLSACLTWLFTCGGLLKPEKKPPAQNPK
jgi:hypothetical protein